MQQKIIGKREFIQHTSQYLKWIEHENRQLIITHQNHPALVVTKIKANKIQDLQGFGNIKVKGDVNKSVLPGYDSW